MHCGEQEQGLPALYATLETVEDRDVFGIFETPARASPSAYQWFKSR